MALVEIFFLKRGSCDKTVKHLVDIQKKKTKPYASRSEQELVGWSEDSSLKKRTSRS